jgi:hypothetical protein
MLMRMMEEIGREKLLKAVDIVNDAGDPTLEKVEQILLVDFKAAVNEAGVREPDQSLLDDEFYVERGDPHKYDTLWGHLN